MKSVRLTRMSLRQLETWPAIDQERFRAGSPKLPPRRRQAKSILPRPTSMQDYIDSYTRGLKWLDGKGWCEPNISPEDRWTVERMNLFADDSLAAGQAPITVRNRVIGIWRVLAIMTPLRDLCFLHRLPLKRKDLRRIPTRDKGHIPDLEQLAALGIAVMEAARDDFLTTSAAIEFRTGLQIAWLASLGLRLVNLTHLEEAPHGSLREAEDTWWIVIKASESKNRKPIDLGFPRELVPYLLEYRKDYRPLLCNGHYGSNRGGYHGARLWVSERGEAQGRVSIYRKVASITKRELGVRVGPHEFRDAIATAQRNREPAQASDASLKLGNSPAIVERHYNHASTRAAASVAAQRLLGLARLTVPLSSSAHHSR